MKKLIVVFLVMILCLSLVGCGESEPSKPISRPDLNLQAKRETVLNGLDNIHMGFKLPIKSGIRVIVGPAWYNLSYEVKEKYASVAAAWALCKYYEEQDFYVVRFKDWRTDKEVATFSLSATRGASFTVK